MSLGLAAIGISAIAASTASTGTSISKETSAALRMELPWALLERTPLALRLVLPWSSPDAEVLYFTGELSLVHQGCTLALGDPLEISFDEGSSLWVAKLYLDETSDYARLTRGDALTLTVLGEVFSLVVARLAFSREDEAPTLEVEAHSPVALYGPLGADSQTLDTVGMAKATVERLLEQTVDWQIVDWHLPASATSLEATPLELAMQIVEAVGGALESLPDGSLLARAAEPGNPLEWTADVTLTDRDLFSYEAENGEQTIADRFVVTSGTQTETLQLESEAADSSQLQQILRAYPYPWREIELVHTGDDSMQIDTREDIETTHTELVEIKAGSGTVSYPVAAVDSFSYQHVDLGDITWAGTEVTTEQSGYSLLSVTYRARAWRWLATNTRAESVQFLAME